MKMQKLVYLAHGWHLAIHDRPLISENFEAWPYGPVEEDLYHIFKPYRDAPITDYAKTWVGNEENFPAAKGEQGYHMKRFILRHENIFVERIQLAIHVKLLAAVVAFGGF